MIRPEDLGITPINLNQKGGVHVITFEYHVILEDGVGSELDPIHLIKHCTWTPSI